MDGRNKAVLTVVGRGVVSVPAAGFCCMTDAERLYCGRRGFPQSAV